MVFDLLRAYPMVPSFSHQLYEQGRGSADFSVKYSGYEAKGPQYI